MDEVRDLWYLMQERTAILRFYPTKSIFQDPELRRPRLRCISICGLGIGGSLTPYAYTMSYKKKKKKKQFIP